jgi:cell division septum initiation protein DivIVA
MTDEGALPEFAVAMRGYDRLQVDDYIVRQAAWLSEARSRMEAAERELAAARDQTVQLQEKLSALEERQLATTPRSLEELGERVTRILQTAWDAAEELRQDAQKEAAEILEGAKDRLAYLEEEAERRHRLAEEELESATAKGREQAAREAAAVVEKARQERDDILAEARAEADRITRDGQRQRQELREEVGTLSEQREAALQDLLRLRSSLEALLSPPAATDEATEEVIDLRSEQSPATATGPGTGA